MPSNITKELPSTSPPFDVYKLLGWCATTLVSLLVFIAIMYGSYTNTTLLKHEEKITAGTEELRHVEEQLNIIDAKLDLILKSTHITYNGPVVTSLHPKK